jgi:glutamate-ammonia-ligase adenylyltransferase
MRKDDIEWPVFRQQENSGRITASLGKTESRFYSLQPAKPSRSMSTAPINNANNRETLDHAVTLSRFLRRLLDSRPALREELLAKLHVPLAETMRDHLRPQGLSADTLKPALRALRARVLAHVAARDLVGLASLAEVTETMSTLADLAVETVLTTLHAELTLRHGEPLSPDGSAQKLIVIGMGKLGGRELNVSSDIDLVFVYPEEGETGGPNAISNFEFFARLGRRMIDALGDITADGLVFRVDMRLRPNGESGPLSASFDMLENYLITQGREWERYAWIKARALTGTRLEDLARIVRPFVFRKYLDYGAFNAMRELHAQIQREVMRRDMANNIKLGPGGIREIEFIAQVFQLIRGGREPALQVKATLKVLDLLAARGILPSHTANELTCAYEFLRRLEHRLQYLDDAQTHELPGKAEDQALIARAMGFSSYAALLEELDDHRANVSRHFASVFADPNAHAPIMTSAWQGTEGDEQSVLELQRLGYRDAPSVASRLKATHSSARYREMPAAIRLRFDALVPRVIEACAETPDPDATLGRCLDLLDAISRRAAYLALLQQYPQALKRVAQLVGSSSWAARFLTRHPLLLDELLDARLLESIPDWPAFRTELAKELDEIEPDTERQMDLMREVHHAQVFRLLTQDLAGMLSVERLADHLSALADVMLDLAIKLVWRKLARRHRDAPRFAVVSYGKLGGKELGYASDLDIIFLYDDEAHEALEIYARLAQRINTWLSSMTPAGILFQTDLRLRPSGEAGLLVSSVEAFRKYQMESAWVWEHQALTRARFSAGDPAIGEAFEKIRIEVLRKPRDLTELRPEVLAMRKRMLDAHGHKSPLFDLKHDSGGLIDVEFIVQYLVLGYSHRYAELTGNLGNIALLGIAADLGLISLGLAERVRNAYREYRRLQHGLRLNDAPHSRVDPASVAALRAAVQELWQDVFGKH